MKKFLIKIISLTAILATVALALIYLLGFYIPEKKEKEETERLIKQYYSDKLSLYAEENEKYEDGEIDVAFLGDSLTDGYDLSAYYPQYKTANRGIGGETTHGLEKRLDVSLYELKPKVAVILIGGNNLSTMFDNYERMIASIREKMPETRIVLCSLTAMGGSLAEKNQLACYNNVIIEKLAERYDCEFVDLYTPLFDISTGEIYADFTSDGAHLTAQGYRVFTDTLTPVLESILK